MFYFLATYQMLSVTAINMTMGLMLNQVGVITTEELEDILEDDDDDFISY
jgi:hypothetical protein